MSANFNPAPSVDKVLVELEAERKKIVSNKLKGWGAIVLGIVAILIVAGIGFLLVGVILAAATIIPGIAILWRSSEEVGDYRSRFKQDVIGAALQTVDQSLTIDPYKGILEGEFRHSQLFNTSPDRYHTEDLVAGRSDKTNFYFAEVYAEYKTETQTKNGRQVSWHDLFKGIIFVADFNKHFNGVTVIRPKDFGSTISAWFSKNVFSIGDKNVVELENDGFNKNFIVYSTDQIEARYILTPSMMEKINGLNNRSAYTISASFINANLYIAFPLNKNYFEPPLFKTLLKPDLLVEDMSILGFMYDIVHELDLNTRIWTKQ